MGKAWGGFLVESSIDTSDTVLVGEFVDGIDDDSAAYVLVDQSVGDATGDDHLCLRGFGVTIVRRVAAAWWKNAHNAPDIDCSGGLSAVTIANRGGEKMVAASGYVRFMMCIYLQKMFSCNLS